VLPVAAAVAVAAPVLAATSASGQDATASPTASPTASISPTVSGSPSPTSSPTPSSPGPPTRVLLAFTDPPPTDPARPCETGMTFERGTAGERETLVVCTYDDAGTPSATDGDATYLTWRIEPVQPGGGRTLRFTSDPPTETLTGAAGRNHAEIEDMGGESFVVVELVGGDGNVLSRAEIERASHVPTGYREVETVLRARRVRGGLRGRLDTEAICRPERQVTLWRRSNRAETAGVDVTGERGRWHVDVDRPGVYWATVAPSSHWVPYDFIDCLRDRSRRIRLRKTHLRAG
jgi:hypothetical protein